MSPASLSPFSSVFFSFSVDSESFCFIPLFLFLSLLFLSLSFHHTSCCALVLVKSPSLSVCLSLLSRFHLNQRTRIDWIIDKQKCKSSRSSMIPTLDLFTLRATPSSCSTAPSFHLFLRSRDPVPHTVLLSSVYTILVIVHLLIIPFLLPISAFLCFLSFVTQVDPWRMSFCILLL